MMLSWLCHFFCSFALLGVTIPLVQQESTQFLWFSSSNTFPLTRQGSGKGMQRKDRLLTFFSAHQWDRTMLCHGVLPLLGKAQADCSLMRNFQVFLPIQDDLTSSVFIPVDQMSGFSFQQFSPSVFRENSREGGVMITAVAVSRGTECAALSAHGKEKQSGPRERWLWSQSPRICILHSYLISDSGQVS